MKLLLFQLLTSFQSSISFTPPRSNYGTFKPPKIEYGNFRPILQPLAFHRAPNRVHGNSHFYTQNTPNIYFSKYYMWFLCLWICWFQELLKKNCLGQMVLMSWMFHLSRHMWLVQNIHNHKIFRIPICIRQISFKIRITIITEHLHKPHLFTKWVLP